MAEKVLTIIHTAKSKREISVYRLCLRLVYVLTTYLSIYNIICKRCKQ